jgi:hypothetical protein
MAAESILGVSEMWTSLLDYLHFTPWRNGHRTSTRAGKRGNTGCQTGWHRVTFTRRHTP